MGSPGKNIPQASVLDNLAGVHYRNIIAYFRYDS
jgi:hypothetical protein